MNFFINRLLLSTHRWLLEFSNLYNQIPFLKKKDNFTRIQFSLIIHLNFIQITVSESNNNDF